MTWTKPEGGPPQWFHRVLTDGAEGDDVLIVQRKVEAPMTGKYDDDTAARVRGVQKKKGLKQSGQVDAATAKELGEKPGAGQVPEWFNHDVKAGDSCECVSRLRVLLRQPNLPVYFDQTLEDSLRQFQSESGRKPTGVAKKIDIVALADRAFNP